MRRFARSLLPSSDGVDDVVQEAALECWRKFSEFSPESDETAGEEFLRWACVIVRFKAISWQRDKGRDRLVFSEDVIEALFDDAMGGLDQRHVERAAVEKCLQKIPPAQRRLVLSVHTPGESVARIAKESGEKSRQLYSQLNLLRKQLLECVRQRLTMEAQNG